MKSLLFLIKINILIKQKNNIGTEAKMTVGTNFII